MKTQYARALSLLKSVEGYREGLAQFSNNELLLKALEKGEISLGDYLIELSLQYESIDKLLDMERLVNRAHSELLMYQ